MTDMRMMIISEDDLDKMFHEADIPSGMVSGRNIKTGCYGLFLVALDNAVVDIVDEMILRYCILNIEDIQDDTMFYSMAIHYPPDNIEYDGIIKLAECVKFIHQTAGTTNAEDVASENITAINDKLMDVLGPTSHMTEILLELEDDIDE
jgi:hypothetical protein